MPPPHLAVLNAQESPKNLARQQSPSQQAKAEGKPARARAGWLRSTVTAPESAPVVPRPRPPAPEEISIEPVRLAPEAVAVTEAPQAAQEAPAPAVALEQDVGPQPEPIAPAVAAERPAERRPPQEDLLAGLPPAQVPLRIGVSHMAAMSPGRPAAVPEPQPRNAAAERAYRIGRQGGRPAHAMSAAEVAAWREGAMEAGRARDSIFGRPRMWWWLALSALLVMPMAYAALWLGLASSGAEFLSTGLGQEAWILVGGPEAGAVYWVLLFALAMLVQMLRPLEPVLIIGVASYWGWLGLHAAWEVGMLAQRIPPLPMPG